MSGEQEVFYRRRRQGALATPLPGGPVLADVTHT